MIKTIKYSLNYDGKVIKYCAVYDDSVISENEAKRIIMSGEITENPKVMQILESQYDNVLAPTVKLVDGVKTVVSAANKTNYFGF